MDQIVVVCILSAIGFTLYGAAGFGASMVFHSLWSILHVFDLCSSEMKEIVFFLNMMHFFGNLPLIVTNRKNFQWEFALAVGLPWFGLVVVGTYILELKEVTFYLKLVLGGILFLLFVQQLFKIFNAKSESFEEVPRIDLKRNLLWVIFIGVIGGASQGLFGMSGPCTIIILTCSNIHVKRWKGNFYAWALPAQLFVLIKYSLPKSQGGASLFDESKIPYYIAMSIFAVFGGMLGDFVSKYLSKLAFQIVILAVCFIGAISNFTILPALRPHKGPIMIASVIIDVILLGAFILLMRKKNAEDAVKDSIIEISEKKSSHV